MGDQAMQDQDFAASHAIAEVLDRKDTDANEVTSCVGYLRDLARDEREGSRFFDYLDTVIKDGRAVVRSGRTLGYYKNIRYACRHHLVPYKDDPEKMAQILGWATRLMRYYAVEEKIERLAHPPEKGERRTGTVKWFSKSKGYGFIKPDGGGDDHFVHISETPGGHGLDEKQQVSFASEMGDKGPRARNVRPL
jgi:cold shock CspA family protein